MNVYSLAVLLFAFGVLLIAILALVKRKDSKAIRFSLFSVSVCGWGFLYSLWTSQDFSPENRLTLIRASEVFAVFIPITWLHFVLDFIGKREPVTHFYAVNYGIAVVLALLCPTPFFFTGIHPVPVFKYYKSPGPGFYVFLLVYLTLVPYAFIHLLRSYRAAVGQAKEQLKLLLIGWFVSFAAGTTTFLPVYNITSHLVLLLAMPLYPVLMGIALIRYGLFDVRQVADAFQRDKLAAIGTLATSINHEIRNPLYVIKCLAESHLENAKEGIYGSQSEMLQRANEVLSKSIEQTTRAMDIMKRFALFAKEGTQQVPRPEEVDLKKTFEEILPLVRHELELDKIRLINAIPSALETVCADRRQVEEIFFNLIVNACQAMRDGGELLVSAEQHNGNVELQFRDDGPGILPEDLPKIFEPFYTTKESGTGLGLYIVKQLVEKNRGEISVNSKVGEGTSFLLSFKVWEKEKLRRSRVLTDKRDHTALSAQGA